MIFGLFVFLLEIFGAELAGWNCCCWLFSKQCYLKFSIVWFGGGSVISCWLKSLISDWFFMNFW